MWPLPVSELGREGGGGGGRWGRDDLAFYGG